MAITEKLLRPVYTELPAVRTGGRTPRPNRFERLENVRTGQVWSSSMPLDTEAHWSWRNPLIILPLCMLALFVVAIIGTLITLL